MVDGGIGTVWKGVLFGMAFDSQEKREAGGEIGKEQKKFAQVRFYRLGGIRIYPLPVASILAYSFILSYQYSCHNCPVSDSVTLYHGGIAVQTGYSYPLGRPDGDPTVGTEILSATGFFGWRSGGVPVCAVSTTTAHNDAVILVAANEDVCQAVFQNKVQQAVAWVSDGPAILGVPVNTQAVGFCDLLESYVVIGAAPATILDVMQETEIVDHLMKQGRTYIFNGPGQCTSSDIDFVTAPIG